MTREVVDLNDIQRAIAPMLNSKLSNYIVPGLTSHLVGGSDAHGRVRLFCAERETLEFITPHSHRFNFTCLVLQGHVINTIYESGGMNAEPWCLSTIDQVCGADGVRRYVHEREDRATFWEPLAEGYDAGNTYSMKFEQIHSIKFARSTVVLFFEGPQLRTTSQMIEPWVNGKVVPTFRTEPWMFERESA